MADITIRDQDQEAAQEYLRRQQRDTNPDGTFDRASRWYPSEAEFQPCCSDIRAPSRGWPYSYMLHCRTLGHVCRLYEANPPAVRMALRELQGKPLAARRRASAVEAAESILRGAS